MALRDATLAGATVLMALVPSAAVKAQVPPASAAPAGGSVAPAAVPPTVLTMVRGPLPWVKRCGDGDEASACKVAAGFARDPLSANTLQIVVDTVARDGNSIVSVVLPLDLRLDAGFTLGWGADRAAVGTYITCGKAGCLGDAVLSKTDFEAFRQARVATIGFADVSGRGMELRASLDGMAEALDGTAVSAADLQKMGEDAARRYNEAVRAHASRPMAPASQTAPPPGPAAGEKAGSAANP